jgi:hypothetical protein
MSLLGTHTAHLALLCYTEIKYKNTCNTLKRGVEKVVKVHVKKKKKRVA